MLSITKKILKLLTRSERKKLYILCGIITVSGVIEVAGIVSIMPFLSLITNPGVIQENQILNWFYTNLGFQSTNRFLIFAGIVVLIILILSNSIAFLALWGLLRFTWMRTYSFSKRLLISYIYQPYVFFLNKNTSLLGKNILSEVGTAIVGVIIPLMETFTRGLVVFFIFIMLIIVDPVLALTSITILGGVYVLIYRLIKNKLQLIGKGRYRTNAERYKVISESFGGIKQLKLLGCEEAFVKNFSNSSLEYVKYNTTNQVISQIPRYIMEIIAFGGVIIVVLYLLITGSGFDDFLPLIGLYAFAIYRLMPSLQAVFKGVTTLRFNAPALDTLYEDINSFGDKYNNLSINRDEIEPLSLKREIKFEGITFFYPNTRKPVINDLNLKIDCNTSVAFVGETGAGKTTIADLVLGLLKPYKGRILIDDIEITDKNIRSWQSNLGYIPQDIYLQDDTIARNIAFGIIDEEIDMKNVKKAAVIANIDDFIVKELPEKYDTIVGERGIRLSGGQRQRLGIARALYRDPEVLVLDEATSALDGRTEKEVYKAIQNIAKTKTLIIIAHRLTTVQECDIIYVIHNGKIVGTGKYEDLLESNKIFRKMAKAHL
jgi:ATP-binding cassette, subfamily B, bacterial PglK